MTMRSTSTRGAAIALAILIPVHIQSEPNATVPYPSDYRKWVHVKSTLITSNHRSFATNGGLHHFYANEKALQGYQTGKFADGSVLVDDALDMNDKDGVMSEGSRRRVAVMVKDATRYAETGGWGFEIFPGDKTTGSLTAQAKGTCFACHGKQKDRDSVFSEFRR
jgi:hypothetical protein